MVDIKGVFGWKKMKGRKGRDSEGETISCLDSRMEGKGFEREEIGRI